MGLQTVKHWGATKHSIYVRALGDSEGPDGIWTYKLIKYYLKYSLISINP